MNVIQKQGDITLLAQYGRIYLRFPDKDCGLKLQVPIKKKEQEQIVKQKTTMTAILAAYEDTGHCQPEELRQNLVLAYMMHECQYMRNRAKHAVEKIMQNQAAFLELYLYALNESFPNDEEMLHVSTEDGGSFISAKGIAEELQIDVPEAYAMLIDRIAEQYDETNGDGIPNDANPVQPEEDIEEPYDKAFVPPENVFEEAAAHDKGFDTAAAEISDRIPDRRSEASDANNKTREDVTTEYLIDTENVGRDWINLLKNSTERNRFVLFYTTASASYTIPQIQQIIQSNSKFDCIPCHTGSNALDFQLVTELGVRVSKNPGIEYVIVSRDTGYDPVVRYLKERYGTSIKRHPIPHISDNGTEAESPPRSKTEAIVQQPKPVDSVYEKYVMELEGRLPTNAVTKTAKLLYNDMKKPMEKRRQAVYQDMVKVFGPEKGLTYYRTIKELIKRIAVSGPLPKT